MTTLEEERELTRRLGWGPRSVPIFEEVGEAVDVQLDDGDLALVSGSEALRQDIAAALFTAVGSDPLAPRFGFDGFQAIAEERDPVLLRERLRVAIVRLLQRDGRVRLVEQVLIGREEIDAARDSDDGSPGGGTPAGDLESSETGSRRTPADVAYGLLEIVVTIRIQGNGDRLRLGIGSVVGSI